MKATQTATLARALYQTHGDKAELETAQREKHSRDAGNNTEAKNWRSIRDNIRSMRGANQS